MAAPISRSSRTPRSLRPRNRVGLTRDPTGAHTPRWKVPQAAQDARHPDRTATGRKAQGDVGIHVPFVVSGARHSRGPSFRRSGMFPEISREDIFRLETRRLWLRCPQAVDLAAAPAVGAPPPPEAASGDPYRDPAVLRAWHDGNAAGGELHLLLTGRAADRSVFGAVDLAPVRGDAESCGLRSAGVARRAGARPRLRHRGRAGHGRRSFPADADAAGVGLRAGARPSVPARAGEVRLLVLRDGSRPDVGRAGADGLRPLPPRPQGLVEPEGVAHARSGTLASPTRPSSPACDSA